MTVQIPASLHLCYTVHTRTPTYHKKALGGDCRSFILKGQGGESMQLNQDTCGLKKRGRSSGVKAGATGWKEIWNKKEKGLKPYYL